MNIENKTKMTFAVQMALTRISTKKIKIISLIIGIIACIIGALLFKNNKVLGVGLIIIGIAVIIVLVLLLNRLMAKEIAKSNLYNGEIENHYQFNEDRFTVTSFRKNQEIGKSIVSYKDIFKLIEDQYLIYIYIDKNHAFAILKSEITGGNINDLISILKAKVIKYKKIKA